MLTWTLILSSDLRALSSLVDAMTVLVIIFIDKNLSNLFVFPVTAQIIKYEMDNLNGSSLGPIDCTEYFELDDGRWETSYTQSWYAIRYLVLIFGLFLFLNVLILHGLVWSMGFMFNGAVMNGVLNNCNG